MNPPQPYRTYLCIGLRDIIVILLQFYLKKAIYKRPKLTKI
jgi:hypothetical protein